MALPRGLTCEFPQISTRRAPAYVPFAQLHSSRFAVGVHAHSFHPVVAAPARPAGVERVKVDPWRTCVQEDRHGLRYGLAFVMGAELPKSILPQHRIVKSLIVAHVWYHDTAKTLAPGLPFVPIFATEEVTTDEVTPQSAWSSLLDQ